MSRLIQLRHQYCKLTNRVLLNLTTARHFSVRHNHCFQRIILDNLFGRCWYKVLSRTGEAAYRQLSEAQLEEARSSRYPQGVALAENIVAQPDAYLHQLNQNSLDW